MQRRSPTIAVIMASRRRSDRVHTAEATDLGRATTPGKGVHAAARIAAAAGAGDILVSRAALDARAAPLRAPRALELKGLAEPVEVAAVAWRE